MCTSIGESFFACFRFFCSDTDTAGQIKTSCCSTFCLKCCTSSKQIGAIAHSVLSNNQPSSSYGSTNEIELITQERAPRSNEKRVVEDEVKEKRQDRNPRVEVDRIVRIILSTCSENSVINEEDPHEQGIHSSVKKAREILILVNRCISSGNTERHRWSEEITKFLNDQGIFKF